MKKIAFLLAFLLLSSLLSLSGAAVPEVSETDDGIFYSISDGEVTVEGFNAVGTVMNIPETIEGMPVRHIAPFACRGNAALTEVKIPSSVLTVGEYAFAEAKNLVTVRFDSGTEVIEASAFRDCTVLASLTLPDTLKTLGDFAFSGCLMLGKTKIPASLTEIGVDVFTGCERLILLVKDNPTAASYAKQYGIATSFTDTWLFTVLCLCFATALLGAGIFAADRYIRKKRKKSLSRG